MNFNWFWWISTIYSESKNGCCVSTVRSPRSGPFLDHFERLWASVFHPTASYGIPPGAPGLSVRLLTTQLHFLAGEKSKMTPWLWKTHNTKSYLPKGEWTVGRFPAFFQGNLVCPNHLQVQLVTLTSKLMAPSKAALSKNRRCKCLWCGCGTKVMWWIWCLWLSRSLKKVIFLSSRLLHFMHFWLYAPNYQSNWDVDATGAIQDLREVLWVVGVSLVDLRSPWFLIMENNSRRLKQNMENWRQKDMDWKILTVRNTWKKTQFSWLKPGLFTCETIHVY